MLNEIYTRRILALAADIPHLGRLPQPDARATAHSRLCGSVITVDIAMSGEKVADYAQEVRACALGQASASIMGRLVIGATSAELRAVRDELRRMLTEGGEAPGGRWAELAALLPVRDFPARHASTMLVFDAVVIALDEIENGKRPAAAAPQAIAG